MTLGVIINGSANGDMEVLRPAYFIYNFLLRSVSQLSQMVLLSLNFGDDTFVLVVSIGFKLTLRFVSSVEGLELSLVTLLLLLSDSFS